MRELGADAHTWLQKGQRYPEFCVWDFCTELLYGTNDNLLYGTNDCHKLLFTVQVIGIK